MIIKRIVIPFAIVVALTAISCLCWYIDYEAYLKPKLLFSMDFDEAIQVCRNIRMERIAELCDISGEELKSLNPQYRTTLIPGDSHPCTLRMPSAAISAFIEAGDSIYVPVNEVETTPEIPIVERNTKKDSKSRRDNSKGNKGKGTYIKVKDGDTLGDIARRHNTTVEKLKSLNNIKKFIYAGQSLRVK